MERGDTSCGPWVDLGTGANQLGTVHILGYNQASNTCTNNPYFVKIESHMTQVELTDPTSGTLTNCIDDLKNTTSGPSANGTYTCAQLGNARYEFANNSANFNAGINTTSLAATALATFSSAGAASTPGVCHRCSIRRRDGNNELPATLFERWDRPYDVLHGWDGNRRECTFRLYWEYARFSRQRWRISREPQLYRSADGRVLYGLWKRRRHDHIPEFDAGHWGHFDEYDARSQRIGGRNHGGRNSSADLYADTWQIQHHGTLAMFPASGEPPRLGAARQLPATRSLALRQSQRTWTWPIVQCLPRYARSQTLVTLTIPPGCGREWRRATGRIIYYACPRRCDCHFTTRLWHCGRHRSRSHWYGNDIHLWRGNLQKRILCEPGSHGWYRSDRNPASYRYWTSILRIQRHRGGTGAPDTGVLTVYPPSGSYVVLNGVINTIGGGGTHGVASGGARQIQRVSLQPIRRTGKFG